MIRFGNYEERTDVGETAYPSQPSIAPVHVDPGIAPRRTIARDRTIRQIRGAIWLYLVLLIVEGALRKWVLPGLATPLLVIRDPAALAAMYLAVRHGVLGRSRYVQTLLTIGVLAFVAACLLGHGNPLVAAYGARTLLLHLPLIFVMYRVFDYDDVVQIGKATLLISAPMALLIVLQFYSPQSAWVNRGVGGDIEGAGFSGALGYFRPPGTFSFTNGTTLFFAISTAFVGFFWLQPVRIDKRLLLLATAASIVAVPFSISRSLFLNCVLVALFSIALMVTGGKYSQRFPALVASFCLAFALLVMTPLFGRAVEVLEARFSAATRSEGGIHETIGDRIFGGMATALTDTSAKSSVFGVGIGLGTNVGAKLTTGARGFLIAENEWQREVGEMGPLLGLSLIVLRVVLALDLLCRSYSCAMRGNALPWMLISVGFMSLIMGGLAQPTSLGFVVIAGGLILAATNVPRQSAAVPFKSAVPRRGPV